MATRIVSIIGVGHSGSTLLDVLIGSIPGSFSAGELTYLPWQLSRAESAGPKASRQKLCSCGLGFRECATWRQIVDLVSSWVGFDVYTDPLRFSMNLMQNVRHETGRMSAERLSRALYSIVSSNRLLSPIGRVVRGMHWDAIRNNWLIADAIGESQMKQLVVDSSKSVLRFKLLNEMRPADMDAIVLMRDIRGVCYSAKKLQQNPINAARGWVDQYNRIYSILSRMAGLRVLGVRYEDMVIDPLAERQRIGGFLRLSQIPSDLDINTSKLHLVAGNKARYSGQVLFRSDLAWKNGLSADEQQLILKIRGTLDPGLESLVFRL